MRDKKLLLILLISIVFIPIIGCPKSQQLTDKDDETKLPEAGINLLTPDSAVQEEPAQLNQPEPEPTQMASQMAPQNAEELFAEAVKLAKDDPLSAIEKFKEVV